jgi:hypothetical protein
MAAIHTGNSDQAKDSTETIRSGSYSEFPAVAVILHLLQRGGIFMFIVGSGLEFPKSAAFERKPELNFGAGLVIYYFYPIRVNLS